MDILEWIGDNVPFCATVCLILSFVFEFTKIPVNPWQWLFRGISRALTSSVNDKLIEIEEERKQQYQEISENLITLSSRIDENERKSDERYVKDLRMKIIDFAGSIRNGKNNSREAFEEIMRIYDDYHDILRDLGETNGYIDTEYELIIETFKEKSKTFDIE